MDETLERLTAVIANVSMEGEGPPRIPTERELALSLGVNRTTVRERLAVLELLGLLRRTQGSGTYLDMPNSTFVRLYFDMAVRLGHVEVGELEQAREMIEHEVARRAATRAGAEDLAALERCVERMLNAGSVEEGDQADYEFHLSLVRASHNPVMVLIVEGLSSVLRQLLRRRRYMVRQVPGGAERTNATHIPILEAIRDRDPDGAVRAIENHFRVWNEESRKLEGLEGDLGEDVEAIGGNEELSGKG